MGVREHNAHQPKYKEKKAFMAIAAYIYWHSTHECVKIMLYKHHHASGFLCISWIKIQGGSFEVILTITKPRWYIKNKKRTPITGDFTN